MGSKKERKPIRLIKAAVEELVPENAAFFQPVVNSKGQGVRGLNVRVLPSGIKTWVHRYRFHGFQKSITLGSFPSTTPESAEKASRAIQAKIEAGTDPGQAKADAKEAALVARQAAVTVADLAERFIAEHIGAEVEETGGGSFKVKLFRNATGKPLGNKESTAREHIRLLRRNILPVLGQVPLKAVGTAEVASLLYKIRKEHPTQSNRVRSVLSKMFAKAELWEMRPAGSNPCRGQDRAVETKKERNLNDLEILALGAALKGAENAAPNTPAMQRQEGKPRHEDPYALAAIKLAILTGMRKAEIIGDQYRGTPALTWKDVDIETAVLRVHHKTETRTGKKRTVYLCRAAKDLLKNLPQVLGNPHVIPGEVAGQPLVNLQLVWDRVRDAVTTASKKEAEKEGKDTPTINLGDVTLHDLRRTFSSVGARLGYPELWIGGLLGHSATTVTQGYARVNSDPLREAVEAIGGRIAGLLDGTIHPDMEIEARQKSEMEKSRIVS